MRIYVNDNGDLRIDADLDDRKAVLDYISEHPDDNALDSDYAMQEILEQTLVNSEYSWVKPEDAGQLTEAPLLGVYGEERPLQPEEEHGYHVVGSWEGQVIVEPIEAVWGFMGYQITSVQRDLLDKGFVIFKRG